MLVVRIQLSPADELGVTEAETDSIRKVLLKKGVPETALVLIGTNISNTFEESQAVRDWAARTGARRVIIPTDIFHTHRAHWLFQRMIEGTPTKPLVTAVNPPEYTATNWWQTEQGQIAFQNEVVKHLFYRLKY